MGKEMVLFCEKYHHPETYIQVDRLTMELMLLLGVLLAILVIYLPGYVMARGLTFDRFGSLASAPLFSLPVITLTGVVLYEANCRVSGGIFFAIVLACSLMFWGIGKVVCVMCEHRSTQEAPAKPLLSFPLSAQIWRTALLYSAVALVIVLFVYVSALPTPDAFSRNDDTTVHLSIVRGFLDSGTYSTIHTSSFLDWDTSGYYYPSAWHCIVAIVASVIGNQVTLATNATITALAVFMIPLGMVFLLTTLFPHRKNIVLSGALFAVAFAAFPWGFIVYGQLLSNLLSFSLVAPTLTLLIWATNGEKRSRLARLIAAVCLGIAALVLAQPNGVFTWGILATLYLISRIFFIPGQQKALWSWKRGLGAAAILIAACALWTGLFFAPPLQRVVTYDSAMAVLSIPEAILAGLSFMFMARGSIQPLLSVFVLLGVIWACKHRRYLWLVIALAFSFILYVMTVSSDPTPLRQFLGGFWYADYRRIGAMTALFAIPLAACGFAWTVTGMQALVKRLVAEESCRKMWTYGATGALVALLVASQIIPFTVDLGNKRIFSLGLINTQAEVADLHSWDSILTDEERAFVQQVQATIPAHALVINAPHDGSAWAYGTDGINVLFRRPANNGSNPLESAQNTLIRTKLADVATDSDVATLLRELDAHYVMLLDAPDSSHPTKTDRRYVDENWIGIESIDEDTPGFTLLLSEGDMRLYEIDE